MCGSTRRVQLDHIVPIALGGTSTVPNLRVVCSIHNIVAARLALGDRVMDRYTATGRGAAARAPGAAGGQRTRQRSLPERTATAQRRASRSGERPRWNASHSGKVPAVSAPRGGLE
ncbi:MAG: HNH endonuclease signature motif containing protein [Anaeromyxobacteraceae bacterium]